MRKGLYIVLVLALGLWLGKTVQADDLKWLRPGNIHMKAVDSGSMHESIGGTWGAHVYNYYDDFQQASVQSRGWHLAVQNFVDERSEERRVGKEC